MYEQLQSVLDSLPGDAKDKLIKRLLLNQLQGYIESSRCKQTIENDYKNLEEALLFYLYSLINDPRHEFNNGNLHTVGVILPNWEPEQELLDINGLTRAKYHYRKKLKGKIKSKMIKADDLTSRLRNYSDSDQEKITRDLDRLLKEVQELTSRLSSELKEQLG